MPTPEKDSEGKTVIKYKGQEVWCYGDVCEESNIMVEATDENESALVHQGYECWASAVKALIDGGNFPSGVEQLEAM